METIVEQHLRLYGRCKHCKSVATGRDGLCTRHRLRARSSYEPTNMARTLRLTMKGRAAIGVPEPSTLVPLVNYDFHQDKERHG